MAPVEDNGIAAGVSEVWLREDTLESVDGLRDLSVKSLRHKDLGTQVVLANVEGPLCSVHMLFATEAHDDKGLPHCLEHLCFMGSRGYRRGYLDLLATRCGSDGPNAYTEADHTCYSFVAAGEGGMLAVLPVFIDHVLCPTLTEEAFLTEIYHVNGKGQRQGVVYSEMLGRATDEGDMLDLELRKATFGEESPYSFEHGGLPECIMKIRREDIVEYHRQVYTADNLRIVVSGSFDQAGLLSAMAAALDASVGRGAGRKCLQRPFVSQLPCLPKASARRRSITFPSGDVSVGSIAYAHRLQVDVFDSDTLAALDCLGRYLGSLASSPLEQAFVQCEQPVASGVSCAVNLTAEPHMSLDFTGVTFHASLQERAAAKRMGSGAKKDEEEDDDEAEDDDDEDGPDQEEEDEDEDEDEQNELDWFAGDALLQRLVDELTRVRDALQADDHKALTDLRRAVQKEIVSRRKSFEDGPNDFVFESLCSSCIFDHYPSRQAASAKRSPLTALVARAAALESLVAHPGPWWADLLTTHLLNPLASTLRGEAGGAAEVRACPSALLALKNESKEEAAAKENKKRLGAKKLKELQGEVDRAEKANQIELSSEQRASFPSPASPACVPDLRWGMELSSESEEKPLEILEVEAPSAFMELRLSWQLDDASGPGGAAAELRRYLPLFAEMLCETDVAGEDYRSVVARLDDDLVEYGADLGRGSPYMLTLRLTAAPEKMLRLVTWADQLVHECGFPEEKVNAACRRMVADIKESMRESETVLAQVVTCALHGPLSPQVLFGSFSQKGFLQNCCRDLPGTCRALEKVRDYVSAVGTACTVVISGSTAERRRQIAAPLQDAWRVRRPSARPAVLRTFQWGAGAVPSPSPLLPLRHFVVGCPGAETSHVQLRAVLPQPFVALDAKGSWSLRLMCEALSMMEGPLSQAVRGKGLAYGASIGFAPYDNAVTLDLWECTNLRKGLDAALVVLRDARDLSTFQLDNARGSLVFQLKGKRATPADIVEAAVGSASRGFHSAAEATNWESQLSAVTNDDALAAHTNYLMRLCDASQVVACVVCEPGECKAKAKGLAACLGLKTSGIFVKAALDDCYDLVDGRIRISCAKQAEP